MANYPFQNSPAFEHLNDNARQAVSQAFDAMSEWRGQLSEMTDKNSEQMFDKMSEAASALGWPTQFVELSREQVKNASKMQTQMIDQVMHTWEHQLTNPGKAMEMPKMPDFSSAMPDFTSGSVNPMQMWMQAAEMWQKSWQQAMSNWMDAQAQMMGKKKD